MVVATKFPARGFLRKDSGQRQVQEMAMCGDADNINQQVGIILIVLGSYKF